MSKPAVNGERGQNAKPELFRGLGLMEATTILVGGIIGSGIFMVPGEIAREVGTPLLVMAVWVVCGVLATSGALCYAELGAAIPESGGTYPFLRHAYSYPVISFLFGWTFFFVIVTGAMGAVSAAFSRYAGVFLGSIMPYGIWTERIVAVCCILFLTIMNCLGVRVGGQIQNLFTFLKVGALLGLIGVGLLFGAGQGISWQPGVPEGSSTTGIMAAFGTAMIGGLFAYSGWHFPTFIAGEVKDPHRNIPRSIILGMGIVVAVYMLANLVYLRVLSFDQLQSSSRVAADTMEVLVGPLGLALISIAVMLSTFGTLNAQLLGAPRIYYAMSRDNLFFRWLRYVHPRFKTPAAAILIQGIWASGFALSGTYLEIVTYAAFCNYLFLSLGVAGVIILRYKAPDLHRPYRVWGYPITPLLFLLVCGGYLVNSLIIRFSHSMVGIIIMLTGLPFYFYWSRRRSQ